MAPDKTRADRASTEGVTRAPVILIANDQEWSARSIESVLHPRGYAVLRAFTGRQALNLARRAQPDALIVDLRLPDLDGADVCRSLLEDDRFSRTTPIFITTASPTDRATRLEAYRAGAWEFCAQPIDGELLLLKLEAFMRAKLDADRIRDLTLLDERTGLYNARGLARRAAELGAEAYRRHAPVACVAFAPDTSFAGKPDEEVDNLADRLTEQVGSVFRQAGRTSDAIGRLGQTEFAVIAPATEASGAIRLAERMREVLSQVKVDVDGENRPLHVHAGYCAVPDFTAASIDVVEMLLRATEALRQARNHNDGSFLRAYDDASVTS